MSITDLFKKGESLFSTTLSSGIGTGTGETITLASVSGLPTDTEITLTLDRVDSEGTATPATMERITGTISGSNLTAYTRGTDGSTEQAHSAGAVIEYIFNSQDWNDALDGILAGHTQAGAHTAASASASGVVELATTAETTTGTDATRAVTPDGLHDMTSLSGAAWLLDEDDMATNSATKVPSQQSVKAYVDSTVTSVASDATPNPTGDKKRNEYYLTALTEAATFAAPSGTPANGNVLIIRILDDGGGETLAWNAIYRAIGITLPTTTTASKTLYVGGIYNSADSKWDMIATGQEA